MPTTGIVARCTCCSAAAGWRVAVVLGMTACAGLVPAGCSSSTPKASGKLTASSFAAGGEDTPVVLVPREPRRIEAVAASGAGDRWNETGMVDVAAVVGTPSMAALPASGGTGTDGSDIGLVLDSLVGQINGNPVYASRFFRDTKLDAALAGLVVKLKNDAAWKAEARTAIRRALLDKIRDELVLAEARSSLTPEQRKGLLFFLEQLRTELISGSGGSEAVVDESLQEREGKNLDEKVQEDLETKLVQREIYQRVASKIIVSWKDVQLEYERRFAEFNPAPVATLRMIWVPTDKPEVVQEFTQALGAGTAFKELAQRAENQFNSGQAGVAERTLKDGVYADTEFFPNKELNDAAKSLSPGGIVGPIAYQRRTAWVHLESINTPTPKSLYDVQLQLDREIKERRFREESEKYLTRLMNSGSFSDVNEMTDKLVAIASDRYLVVNRP